MIEQGHFTVADAQRVTREVRSLSSPHDPRWTGIWTIEPNGEITLDATSRHDLFVLDGAVKLLDTVEDPGQILFLSRRESSRMQAGAAGAVLFVYRERGISYPQEAVTLTAENLQWRPARRPLINVAQLADGAHSATLVRWEAGARTGSHHHPRGEELFVLSGELRDGDVRYRPGSWVRLFPGDLHAPYAEAPTLIILRNGHLFGGGSAT
jgi:hypothetical protein